MSTSAPLASARRGELVENTHSGYVVVLDRDGRVAREHGHLDRCFPRSTVKVAQAAALVRNGFAARPELLALAAASHLGEPAHVAGVVELLEAAGLGVDALRTPPDLPLDPGARRAWLRAGRDPEPVAMNCSGKHAAMLATCVVNGWPTAGYLDPDHPVQRAIRLELGAAAECEPGPMSVDGCGSPVLALPLDGLARLARNAVLAVAGEPVHAVAAAMRAHPWYVGGTTSDVTTLMSATSGLLVKNGADGVAVAALPDGRALALKVADGNDDVRRVVLAALLSGWGIATGGQETVPVLGGGLPVGELRALPEVAALTAG